MRKAKLRKNTFWKPVKNLHRYVSVHMLLLSYLPKVKNYEPRGCPYSQPCTLHRRDQKLLVIALHTWKLAYSLQIRTNYIDLLGGKFGHRSEYNVCQSPHPNKHMHMYANANWCTAPNHGPIWTYLKRVTLKSPSEWDNRLWSWG